MPSFSTPEPTYTARISPSGEIVRNTHCPRCEASLYSHNGQTQHVRNGPLGGTHYGTNCTPRGRGLTAVRSKYAGPICNKCKRAVQAGHTIHFYPLRHVDCSNFYSQLATAVEQTDSQPSYTVDTSAISVPPVAQLPTPAPSPNPTNTPVNPVSTQTPETISQVVAAINAAIVPRINAQLAERDANLAALANTLGAHVRSNDTDFAILRKQVENLAANQPIQTIINITMPNGLAATIDMGEEQVHFKMPTLLRLLRSLRPKARNVWLTGPIGAGKSHAVEQCARLLTAANGTQGIGFYTTGAVDSKHELLGYTDANGKRVVTAFQHAWTFGGVYLQDEYDASAQEAQLALNGATANGHVTFPGDAAPTPRHPDCYIICACNTWGFGSVDNLVGRVRTDDSTLSRYVALDFPIDTALERRITTNHEWLTVVQAVRAAAIAREAAILATPRQSLQGDDLLAGGFSKREVVDIIWARYLTHESWPTVGRAAEAWANS